MTDDFGKLVYETRDAILDNLALSATHWRTVAERLQVLKPLYVSELGLEEFTVWRQDLGISDTIASKMKTVAENIPWEREDTHVLPSEMQYNLARAIRDGADFEEAVSDAKVLGIKDFALKWGVVKPRETTEKRCECPNCHFRGVPEDFRASKE